MCRNSAARCSGSPACRAPRPGGAVLENNQPLGGADSFGHIAELDPLNSEYIRWQYPNDNEGNLYKGGGHADLRFLGGEPGPYAEKHFYAKQTKAWQNDYSDLIELLRVLGQADDPGGR
ncbi:MAG: hypothetical protein CM1200mP34_5530 [Verrucomicrobiales bacterium]|nr:MAG: hypothetical protein CM1200mP34_5530 [Verrucomicrobiales bacterium]